MAEKFTKEQIVEQFRETHGDFYDYSLVEYKQIHSKVKIICPEHGVFEQTPNSHKHGNKCPKCSKAKVDQDDMLKRFVEKHGDLYDYSKSVYTNQSTETCIICKEHGEFYQLPQVHWSGSGCPKCSGKGYSEQEILSQFKEIHGDRYDYSKFKFINKKIKSIIICKIHGEFEQSASIHLQGSGCLKCAQGVPSRDEVIQRFKDAHGDKYNYSKMEYEHTQKKCV